MRVLTHSRPKEVRKTALQHLKPPVTPISLLFIGKRLRDKEDEIRKLAYQKLTKFGVKIQDFQSLEQRMLILKEGLTDSNPDVLNACIEFLKPSMHKSMHDENG